VQSRLRSYPDFPKAGILFYDVFSVLGDKEAFPALLSVIKDVAASHKDKVDVVVGLDARGFIFAPIMAEALGVPFVPVTC
jgi:adenine phosphoribosyltransferase